MDTTVFPFNLHGWGTLLRYSTMLVVAALMLLPLAWMFVSSLRPAAGIFQYTSVFSWRTRSETITLDNYQ